MWFPLRQVKKKQTCLDVARYAFCKPKSNPQDIRGQSTQSLMTDLGLRHARATYSMACFVCITRVKPLSPL